MTELRKAAIHVGILALFIGMVASPPIYAQASAVAPAEYNPMRAHHDVNVGKFYMHTGDLAGAIARFKDAIVYEPNYAEPRMLLGEAYEKDNDPKIALRYYEDFLKILPESPDSKKVRERVAKLKDKIKKEAVPTARN